MSAPSTREEMHALVKRMTDEYQTQEFQVGFRKLCEGKGVLYPPQLVEIFETHQVKLMNDWGMNGTRALKEMKRAVKTYPDPDTKLLIMRMCEFEERILNTVAAECAAKQGFTQPAMGQDHSHSHSHGHGHGHGGQCPHGHNMPSEGQVMLMQMAMQSMSKEQMTDMQNIQMKVMSGSTLTQDEQNKMAAIQQHLMAYMSTMANMLQQQQGGGAAKPAAASATADPSQQSAAKQ